MEGSFFNSGLFSYLVIPLFIFFARICDVSFGTMRIIFVSKGKRNIAPFLGFFEVLIWITAITKIMQNLDNYVNYVAYAAGFATGNFVGMIIEEKLAVGIQMIRVFASENGHTLAHILNEKGFGTTIVEAHGARQNVLLIYTIVKRTDINDVMSLIEEFNPKAFYTIEDVKAVNEGVFLPRKKAGVLPLRYWRKGK